jgi:hypothetical protein
MTPAEWAAFVGAAAWLPQIGQWLYGWLAKPALRISSGTTIEMGYSNNYGPIANPTLALSTSRKDAIIEKMTVEVKHEQGDTHLLTWVALNENFSEIRNPAGEVLEVGKNQAAIALKVSTLGLTEKKVLFQDLAVQARHRELTSKMGELFSHLSAIKEEKVGEKITKSQEFARAAAHFKDNMYWKEGKYLFTIRAYEIRSRKPHEEQFDVVLTRSDVDALRRNSELYETDTRELYLAADRFAEEAKKPEAERKPVEPQKPFSKWQWIYPQIHRHEKK